ncbi:MAG: BatD family protein [Prevotella sp.]|nr:BatD family protein [Prevotella sp.]
MKMNTQRYLLLLQLVLASLAANSQSLTVNAPSHVETGENFRLTYTVNTQDAEDFHIGNIPEGLEIITGPYTSSQSTYQMVNGHTSSSSSITYTFIICAVKNGTYTIPPARVNAGGKSISSQAAKISVTGQAASSGGAPKMHEDNDGHQMRQAGSAITGNDLFIKVSANKRRVHEQEPILLSYKVYTLVDLVSLEGKMPDLTGFHSQEIASSQQPSYHVEQVNGRNYRCVTWKQYMMYPQMTGELEIPSITFEGIVVQQNRAVDPFEAFFNGGSGYVEVKRSIKAPGLKIQVDPLPERPANFSGGVGKFNISAHLNKTTIKANDPLTLRVVVSGNGNLKLIKQPVVNFSKDFDKYDPKVTDKTRLTSNGVEGNMIYDFLVVPRNQGNYQIPPVEFTYYDTGLNAYKTIKSQAFDITVEKGDGDASAAAVYAEQKNQDIRGIKTEKDKGVRDNGMFYGSAAYWTLLGLILAVFVALLVMFRQRAIENADIVKMRSKKANKVATKRLKVANRLMQQQRQGEFYDEVLRALWGYVGDKLNIPVSELSKENIEEKLQERNVGQDTVSKFVNAIDECEFERYAPGDPAGNMNKTFTSAMTAITQIEEDMKKKRHSRKASAVVLLWGLLALAAFSVQPARAITKQNADAEYSKGNYVQAIKDYEELLKKNKSATLYYNLGNAYYRTDNITQAVLAYERALLLSPGDDDIKFNLQMARSKTIDKITPESEMFFFSWGRSLVNLMSVDGWATLSIVSIALALVLLLVYLFSSATALRKVGFFGGILLIILFVLSNIFAYKQRSMLENRKGAIVISPSLTIKKTPSAGSSDVSVIHEGTRVDITDDTMRDWKAVKLADGREGWVPASQIEKI